MIFVERLIPVLYSVAVLKLVANLPRRYSPLGCTKEDGRARRTGGTLSAGDTNAAWTDIAIIEPTASKLHGWRIHDPG